ncbi:MAG: hypothetical protein HZB46_12675, partial [Solirubrobacterales bacterium]|nr:hypothetical protein [Solirubrobacterales bacterium]
MSRPRSVLLAALLAAVAAPGPAAAAELRIFPVAGGAPGFGGDGGPAWRARMSPTAVQPAADGGLLVLDAHSERVRRIAPDGTVTTVAGTGVRGFRGD